MINSMQDMHKPTLGHLLARVSRLVGGRIRTKLEEIGLPQAQGMVLFHLWQKDGIAQNVLAQTLRITPPTATSTLQRMERDGWIQRQRDTADQRIVRVHLTEKARALRHEARTLFREIDEELTSVLTDDERRILTSSLLKVQQHLSEPPEDATRSVLRQGISHDREKENR
jgi:MarR family transcriptional regulator, organic hydroperoxide resistance regulator